MKKLALIIVFAILINMAKAQTVIGLASQEELEGAGLSSTKTELPGGTVIVDNQAGAFGLACDDNWGIAYAWKNYPNVKVGNSEELYIGYGAVGSTNPTFYGYEAGVMSAGAVFELKAKKDGWMTVFTKLNPNKQYVVMEGKTGAISYTLGVSDGDYKINYTLPAVESGAQAGYIDFNSANADRYFVKTEEGYTKPQFPWLVAGFESGPGESTGFLTFRVSAGKTYYVCGLGTKMACGGFVFTESATAPEVTLCDYEGYPEVKFKANLAEPEIVDPSGSVDPPVNPPVNPPTSEPIVSGNSTIVLSSLEGMEELGLSSVLTETPGGTVILDSDVASFALAYTDSWGTTQDWRNYQYIKIGNSEEFALGYGVRGNANPTFDGYEAGVMSAGAVFELKAKKAGWITIFTKLNPNKQYVVMEGESGAIPYTLGVSDGDYKINYTLPTIETGAQAGYIDFNAADADRYFVKTEEGYTKPQYPWQVAGFESAPAESTGFLTFHVSAGKTYRFSGLGTKMACGGFVFTDTESAPEVTFSATEERPEVRFKANLAEPEIVDPSGTVDPPVNPPVDPPVSEPIVSGNSLIVLAGEGNLELAGISNVKTELPGGTIILDSEAGRFGLAYTDDWGRSSDWKLYRNVKVGNSEEFALGYGVVGTTNPKFAGYESGVMSGGAVFEFQAKKNGWITVFGHMNSHKQYVVFEGTTGALPYTIGLSDGKNKINYTLPALTSGPEAGYIDFNAADADMYFVTEDGQTKPQFPYLVAGVANEDRFESTGFLTFHVRAGKTYYFSGLGTKMACGGFVFTDTEDAPAVSFSATDELPAVSFATDLKNPDTFVSDFEYEGIWYSVISQNAKTCRTKAGENYSNGNEVSGNVTIPSAVSYNGASYTVTEVGEYSFCGNHDLVSIKLPDSIEAIGVSAFSDCWVLGSINIPNGVKRIENGTFLRCDSLRSIEIPEGVTSIGPGAFELCYKLESLELPKSVTSIGTHAFYDCSGLTTITIPAEVKEFGEGAFFVMGDSQLKMIDYLASTLVEAPEDLFSDDVYKVACLNTPNATVDAILAATPWKKFTHAWASNGALGYNGGNFEYEGITYSILDPRYSTCKVADTGNVVSGFTEIPDQVDDGLFEYYVTEIGSESFAGSSDLQTISLPSTIESVGSAAFKGCGRLTSVIWRGNRQMPGSVMGAFENPNLLVYVDSVKFAPEGLDHNVVAQSECRKLELQPGFAFTPYESFTALTSSLTKEFTQETAYDGCAGWETIVLPFDVARIATADGRFLTPFTEEGNYGIKRPFWLYEADAEGLWKPASAITAGVPYLIAMPNNPRYVPDYNIQGAVTFSNPNPQKITTETVSPYAVTWATGREFRSLWLPLAEDELADAMGLNVGIVGLTDEEGTELAPGSAFHADVAPAPLEAYVTRNGGPISFLIGGMQSGVLTMPEADGLTIAQEGSKLLIKSDADRTVDIYSADGTMLRRVALRAGEPVYVDSLPQGVCIIAGRKVMIR